MNQINQIPKIAIHRKSQRRPTPSNMKQRIIIIDAEKQYVWQQRTPTVSTNNNPSTNDRTQSSNTQLNEMNENNKANEWS